MTYGHKKSLRPEALGETVALTEWIYHYLYSEGKGKDKKWNDQIFLGKSWENGGKILILQVNSLWIEMFWQQNALDVSHTEGIRLIFSFCHMFLIVLKLNHALSHD